MSLGMTRPNFHPDIIQFRNLQKCCLFTLHGSPLAKFLPVDDRTEAGAVASAVRRHVTKVLVSWYPIRNKSVLHKREHDEIFRSASRVYLQVWRLPVLRNSASSER
jgi:hypothetical protein